MAIYLQADGATGNVSAQGYENWIQLLNFQFGGISQAVHQRTGSMNSRIGGSANFGLVYLQKLPDSSTSFWFNYACSNTVIPDVEIDFVVAGNPSYTYQTVKLSNVFVSYFSQQHEKDSFQPVELLSLAYDTLEVSYFPRSADNSPGNPMRAGFNVASGAKM